jgi:hypothetical protein
VITNSCSKHQRRTALIGLSLGLAVGFASPSEAAKSAKCVTSRAHGFGEYVRAKNKAEEAPNAKHLCASKRTKGRRDAFALTARKHAARTRPKSGSGESGQPRALASAEVTRVPSLSRSVPRRTRAGVYAVILAQADSYVPASATGNSISDAEPAAAHTASAIAEPPLSPQQPGEPAPYEPAPAAQDRQTSTAEEQPAPAQPAPAQSSSPPAPGTEPAKEKPGSAGTFKVDEQAAERALERALTTSGVLLLRRGGVEIESTVSYMRTVRRFPTLLQNNNGDIVVRDGEDRHKEYDLGVRALFGLPFDSQFEIGLPYQIVDRTVMFPEGLSGMTKESHKASELGDLSLGFAKTLMRERGWRPDLVGRVTWDTDTGSRERDGIQLNGGFHELRPSLSAVKRQDPLALVGSVFYQRAFAKNNQKPGDQYGVSLGVSLAASPETALSAVLQEVTTRENKVDGKNVTGTDKVAGSLLFGAALIVGRGSLLSVTTGVGLNNDAPDYSANLSWSLRLN